MPKYVIERNLPGAGEMTELELKQTAEKSCEVLREMGTDVQWIESYVTDNKIFCVYIAENEALIREHGKRSGFPVDAVNRVRHIIDPTTSEDVQAQSPKNSQRENLLRQ